jgi:hypothetical protein
MVCAGDPRRWGWRRTCSRTCYFMGVGARSMFKLFAAARWAGLVGGVVGCGGSANESNPTELRDTTGLVLSWNCTNDACSLGQTPGAPAPSTTCNEPTTYVPAMTMLFSICSLASCCGFDCRAVVCSSTADCPQFTGHAYACKNGLCEATWRPAVQYDWTTIDDPCSGATPRMTGCSEESPEVAALFVPCGPSITEPTPGCVLPPNCPAL